MKPINVLHIVPSLDLTYGGPAISAPSLGAELEKRGVACLYFSVAPLSGPGENDLMAGNPNWFEADGTYNRRFAYSPEAKRKIEAIMDAHDVSIIHLHNLWSYTAWTAYRVAKRRNVPIVLSPRSDLYLASQKKSRLLKQVARRVYADDLLSRVAGFHATDVAETEGIEREGVDAPILISPNGVDQAIGDDLPDKKDARRALGLNPEYRYMLFLSRLHRRKNPDMLLRAAIASGMLGEGWGLIFAGPADDPRLVQDMQQLAAERGLSHRIYFPGQVSGRTKQNCFAASDLFALPSKFENFGNSVAEALACQVPAITTTGMPWGFLPEEGAGWSIPAEEQRLVEVLAEATRLTAAERAEMGAAGRRIAARYTWQQAAKDMEDFYRSILEQAGSNPVQP